MRDANCLKKKFSDLKSACDKNMKNKNINKGGELPKSFNV